MELTDQEVQEMLLQAQEQSGGGIEINATKPEATKTIKEGDIIAPKVGEYKDPETLRTEAEALALETEKLQEITVLEARLLEDSSLTPEERAEIEATLKTLKPVEENQEVIPETQEEIIARLKQEVEDLKNGKKPEEVINPLAIIEEKVSEAGLDLQAFHKEYIEKGELSEETLNSLNKAGFDKNAIDVYVETKRAQGEAEATKLVNETVGSYDNYKAMATWMQDNMTPEEINKYDAGVNTEHAKIYIENMYAKYTKATTVPNLIRDRGYVREAGDVKVGFKSINEQNLAMADARYGRDMKYTNEVRTKAMNSIYS